jgi:opacity protein-like surface antigen
MSSARFVFCATIVLAALASVRAHAADYTPPPPIIIPPPPVEEFSGWYLRGDIGMSNQQVGSLYNTNYANFSSVTNVDKGFDAAPLFGIGVGYYFNDWLRFDVTGEYRAKANFHGFDIGALPGGGGGFADDRYTASKSEWTFLFNGYVDLGTWYNFTPFVGAGIGFSRNTISNFADFSTCINSNNCAGNGGSDAYAGEYSKWSFAWALHAGVSYKITKNFSIELAYRYINLGNAQTQPLVAFDGTTCGCHAMEFHNLTSHDIKLGLRFNLDGFYEHPHYYPQPVVYQQPVYQPAYPQPAPVYQPAPTYQQPAPVYRSRG